MQHDRTRGVPIDGYALYKTRQDRGFSQHELAGLVGLSQTYVSAIEVGHRVRVSGDALNRLAQALQIPKQELQPKANQVAA